MTPYESDLYRIMPYVIHRDKQVLNSFRLNKGMILDIMYKFTKLSPLVQAAVLKNKPSISFFAADFNQNIVRELYLATGERNAFDCLVEKQIPIPDVGVIVQISFKPIDKTNTRYTFLTHSNHLYKKILYFFNSDYSGSGEGVHYEIDISDKEKMVLNEIRKIRNETALKVNRFKLEHLMDSKLNQLMED